MHRRKFTKAFKEAALRKLRRGRPEEEVARACRVNRWILRRWKKESNEFGERAFGGYGRTRGARPAPKSRAIIIRLSADELDGVKAASAAAGFSNLAEFARFCMFHSISEPSPAQVENITGELGAVVRKLNKRLAKQQIFKG